MPERIENRMMVNSEWESGDGVKLAPVCSCCEEVIRQERALHMLSGRTRIWICDRYIEDMKEEIGY